MAVFANHQRGMGTIMIARFGRVGFAQFGALLLLALTPVFANATADVSPPPALVADGASHDAVTPIHVRIQLDRLPTLGKPATVTCEVRADMDAPGTTASIELPANVRFAGGTLHWEGDLTAGQTIVFSASIVADVPGDTTILGRALRRIDARNVWGDLAAAHFSVGATASRAGFAPVPSNRRIHDAGLDKAPDGTIISSGSLKRSRQAAPPAPPPPAHEPIAPAIEPVVAAACPIPDEKPGASGQQPACGNFFAAPDADTTAWQPSSYSQPASPLGNLTVTGTWSYYDRDGAYTSAREFLVELVQGDNAAHLAWCFTDLSGNYTCGPVANPGGVGVRTILYSWTSFNPNPDTLAIVNPDWGTSNATGNAYRVQTGIVVLSDGTQSIGSWHVLDSDTNERAYWTLQDVIDVWRYIHFNGGGGEAGPTTVQWKIDSTDGPYYSPGANVHLRGEDPLAHAGTVTKHEYGHNILYTAYGGYYPPFPNCNPHNIQQALSAGCGWTEGWAEFLPSVVNNEAAFYWPSGARLDLETPTWGTPGWDSGDWPEGRIAGAMWDMFDVANDGDDTYSDGAFANFWDVIYNVNSDTFSQWWASWIARGHNNVSWGPIMGLYQNTINYRNGPANDDFANAIHVSSAPFYVNALDVTGATTQGLDPQFPCGSATSPRQSRSVWYAFNPSITDVYKIDTQYSGFDTVLAIWRGYWGSLANRGCNDDTGGSVSEINATLVSGRTYMIEATAYGSGAGGSLYFAITRRAGDRIFSDDFGGY